MNKEYLSRGKSFLHAIGYGSLILVLLVVVFLITDEAQQRFLLGSGYQSTEADVLLSSAYVGFAPTGNYSYLVNGTTYFGFGQIQPIQDNGFTYTTPKTIKIYYDPNNPQNSYPEYQSFWSKYLWEPLGLISIPLLMLLFIGWLGYYLVWGVILGRAKPLF